MLPGILLITIASGIAYTAYRLFMDLQGGIFERFQSMPIARSSALWAHVLTSLVANLISLAVVVGVAPVVPPRMQSDMERRQPAPSHGPQLLFDLGEVSRRVGMRAAHEERQRGVGVRDG